MGAYLSISNIARPLQTLLTFLTVSICLFMLSILTYFTLRKHLMPVTHLVIPISLGFPPSINIKNDTVLFKSETNFPSYLVSHTNLSDTIHDKAPLDIYHYTYRIELTCHSPRSYRNRQLGSFFVQLLLYSTSNELICEHTRLILFPYQSEIVRLVRTIILLPLSLFHIDSDQWHLKQTLIERLVNTDKTKRFIEVIQLNIIPSAFQLDQCSIHFHILNLTGLVYSFINYPILTGFLSICVLFSIYMSFYLIITGLSMLNQLSKRDSYKKNQ